MISGGKFYELTLRTLMIDNVSCTHMSEEKIKNHVPKWINGLLSVKSWEYLGQSRSTRYSLVWPFSINVMILVEEFHKVMQYNDNIA